jgi:hypothetical protein
LNILTKQYKSFENKVSFIGYCLIAVLGLVFMLGVVNPIKIPSDNEFISLKGVVEEVEDSKFSILIKLRPSTKLSLKYLKRSGDWKVLTKNLNKKIGKPLEFVCSNKQIYFRTQEDEDSCFVFGIKDQNDVVVDLNQTIANTSKLNTYFFIFGVILFLYGSVRIYFKVK